MKALKKLFAAALASSLSFAANAQAPAEAPKPAGPTIKVYGAVNVNAHYSQAKGATTDTADVSGRGAVSVDSSGIGVRATLPLGMDGVEGTVQCETSANVDGIGVSGMCNRNSRLGISTPVGTIFYGNWDTPFKAVAYGTKGDDPFGNTDVYGFQGIMGSPGNNSKTGAFVGVAPGDAAAPAAGSRVIGFDLRAQNSIGFHSAKFSGLSFKLQYSVAEFASVNGQIEPQLFGAAVNYDQGPLSVFAAYERHDDAFGLNNVRIGSMDWAWRAGAGYELPLPFGPLTLGAMVEQLTYTMDDAPAATPPAVNLTEYNRLAWQVSAKQRIGQHELRARYNMADDGSCDLVGGGDCDALTEDRGASMIAVGYAYHFTPTFQTYVSFAQIMNKDAAQYTFGVGGAPAVSGSTPAGADPLAAGVGFRFAF